jgi:hypothetical protein
MFDLQSNAVWSVSEKETEFSKISSDNDKEIILLGNTADTSESVSTEAGNAFYLQSEWNDSGIYKSVGDADYCNNVK